MSVPQLFPKPRQVTRLAASVILLSLPVSLLAQRNRIPGKINSLQWTTLAGNVHPSARSEYDQGKAPDSLRLNSITLVLQPSSAQQADLEQLLADQQNPASQNYHRWLTPEEYADRFGLNQNDIDKIVDWAKSAGLTVTSVARSRNAVRLQGSAAQAASAFHTEIHLYLVDGETHFANATNPSVPAALQNVVSAIHGMHNFRMKPNVHTLTPLGTAADGASPNYTSGVTHYLAPDDFATIFDAAPLYSAGLDLSGQKIVVVGQSRIVTSHLSTFTTYFGLPGVSLTTTLVPNTQDPGIVQSDEQESDLDLQWASAMARGANLIFVYSYDVNDAVQYAIDQNLAPVLSMSYGECESSASRSDATTLSAWAVQAAAQGISWVAASGDSGAASCYEASTGPFGGASASLGLAVDLPASIPEVTGVGGTRLNEGSGTYWNTTNSSTRASALSYIPEIAWNDSAAEGSPAASGGGASQFFTKPSWQTGTGVPSDGARDVPDVAFPASYANDGYWVYTTSGRKTDYYVFGGTSCGTPVFAGLLAILNQYVVAHGYQTAAGLGNVNTHLYSFATSMPSAFHDITSGNNIVSVACTTPRCTGSTTSSGYSAGVGYDQVTGLGSVDAYKFVAAWHSGVLPAKSTAAIAVAAAPAILTGSESTTLTATVTSSDGSTPTGTVTFSAGTTVLATVFLSGSSGSATATLTIAGSATALTTGSNTITAVYNGDGSHTAATTVTTLTVVSSSSAPPEITLVEDSASFRKFYAPGMLMTIFGTNLAFGTEIASTLPLPQSLGSVSVTVNGVAAPFLYISPVQLNVQIPYETPVGTPVTVVVNNGSGPAATTNIELAAEAPAIFTDANGAPVLAATAARGQTVALYVTGAGAVQPSVATGAAPSAGVAPAPVGSLLVTVGGVEATPSYVAIPTWSVGVLQINLPIPSAAPLGAQSVVVSINGVASAAAILTVTN